MSNGELEGFLWFQGFAILIALLPFFVGLYHYRLDRKLSRAGGRVTGHVTNVWTKAEVPEIKSGPNRRKGQSAQHTYSVTYQCHNGFTRTMEFHDSGRKDYKPGDSIEVAFLYANADIAKPAYQLFTDAYFNFFLAAFFVALPSLFVAFFWLLQRL